MSLVFRENAKNRQNHGAFEGAVMGVNNFHRYLIFLKWESSDLRFPLQTKLGIYHLKQRRY